MPAHTLTLRDIADLAGVQRPVVTMWRRRASIRGQQVDFPLSVARDGGIEHFSRSDVEAYLAEPDVGRTPTSHSTSRSTSRRTLCPAPRSRMC